jgi:hypothetical protein
MRRLAAGSLGWGEAPHVAPVLAGMFIWPQIDDQRQHSLVTAGAQTTNTSEAVYLLTAVSV